MFAPQKTESASSQQSYYLLHFGNMPPMPGFSCYIPYFTKDGKSAKEIECRIAAIFTPGLPFWPQLVFTL